MQRLKIAAELMRIGAGTAAAGRAEASGKADPPGMPDGTLKRSRAASATVSFLCLYHGYYRLDLFFIVQTNTHVFLDNRQLKFDGF